MTKLFWRKVRGGGPGSRILSAYIALVLAVAVVGPGIAVYAAEGDSTETTATPAIEIAAEAAVDGDVAVVDEPAAESIQVPEADSVADLLTAPVAAASGRTATARPICDGGVKLDNSPRSGTYTWDTAGTVETPTTPSDYQITITIHETADGMTFDFVSNYPVVSVGVKGGNDYQDYTYNPAVYSGYGLHAPINASGDYADVSHIIFCFGEEEEPETGDLIVHKYLDANTNGVYDTGDTMLGDWEFAVTQGDTSIGDGLTDANGTLLFSDLEPGEYTVTETQQDGWHSTTGGLTQSVTVVAGETAVVCFGNAPDQDEPETGDLIIYKYLDANANGVYDDGEEMLEGWEFTVTQESLPLSEIAAIQLIGSGPTDEFGELPFTGLEPGEYVVTETMQDGWHSTTGVVETVEVIAGETTEVWFGNAPDEDVPGFGALIIKKFYDDNENSHHEQNEVMLEGWEFTLYNSGDEVVGTGTTDENGEILFADLEPGEYTAVETLQDGWDNTTALSQGVTVVEEETAELWFGNIEFLPYTELDLAITKKANVHTVKAGDYVIYTLTWWNNGDLAAEDYTIVDDYDERYVDIVDASGGVVANGKITWTFAGPLAKEDGKQTLTYKVKIKDTVSDEKTTNIDNVVVIAHPDDTDPTNNTDDERVVVNPEFLPFTGGDYALILAIAFAAIALGGVLRFRAYRAV